MPSEEYYDECNEDVFDDALSDNNFTKSQRKNNENKKKLFLTIKDDSGNDRYIYGSKGRGSYIYSATTGYRTLYKVGSLNEDLFFSVIDSRGVNSEKEPITFYFDSPEQFERVMKPHFPNCTISQNTKEKWHSKFLIAKNRAVNKL
jgi:hypothetical protein